jgi:hypothetical protein
MPDANALYPQAPTPQQGFLSGGPQNMIGTLQAIQNYQLQNSQIPALSQQPAANLQNTNIANSTAQFQQEAGMSRAVQSAFATGLAGIPNPTAEDVHNLTATISRSLPQIATTRPDIINAAAGMLLTNSKGIKNGVDMMRNMNLSPEAASSLVPAPPDPNSGVPQQQTLAASNLMSGSRPSGLAPGESGILESSAGRAAQLQATASNTAQYHADLENLKQESGVLGNLGGPSFQVEKQLNQLSQRLAGIGVTMTPDQLRAGESFDKIANQISLNQSKIFHDSDAGLHTVVGANPSTSMSKYGREGVIDMLQGNQDAIDTTRKMWLTARAQGAPANSYDTFTNKLSQVLDPRVFQFNRLSRPNQQTFLNQMDPNEIPTFEAKYKDAIGRGWVKPLTAAQ